MKYALRVFFCCSFILIIFAYANADTIKLKNGRSIEGVIKGEDAGTIELEVGSGSVRFLKSEIADIVKSSKGEIEALRERWLMNKIAFDNRLAQQKMEEASRPRKAVLTHNAKGMSILVNLNNKVDAEMVLDTGASLMLITRNIARKLGINLDRLKPDMTVTLADGRSVKAARIILDSVKVEDSQVKNVIASVLMEEGKDLDIGDGLLGMSFLKHFNFKIDQKNKRLILEKL